MATYYVDYVSGVDTNNGTSTSTPWKHCVGDAAATGVPDATTLQPGDTVNFKGGVKYRGEIAISASGTSGSRITFQTATGWGTGKAIITGAETLSLSWTQCTSAADCWDNPNWAHIYRTSIPVGFTWWQRLFQNGVFLYPAQSPTPSVPVLFERLLEWHPIPYPYTTRTISSTACKDPYVFTQSSSSYWNGSYIMAWETGNICEIVPITGFTPATDTITYTLSSPPYDDRTTYYTLFNHPALISQAGQYAVRPDENRIYIWTSDDSNPNSATLEYAARNRVMYATGDYITIDNLYITGTYGDTVLWYGGTGIMLDGTVGCTVKNCEVAYVQSNTNVGAIRQGGTGPADNTYQDNYLHHLWANRGFSLSGGSNIIVENNIVEYLSYTGMIFYGASNSVMRDNIVRNLESAHGNGISVYSDSNGVIVERNSVAISGTLITHESSDNIIFRNNLLNGLGTGYISQWAYGTPPSGYIYWINNTMVNGSSDNGKMFRPRADLGTATYIVKNNVIDGGWDHVPAANRSHNVYTDLSWEQLPEYGWSLSTGEQYDTDTDAMFTNYAGYDFTLKPGSCLVGAGTNTAPTYGVTVDILNLPRSGAYDIGAYRYRDNRIAIGVRGE